MMLDEQEDGAPERQYFWPNRLGRIYLLALEDVMGKNGIQAILNQAGLRHRLNNYPPPNLDLGWSFEEMSTLHQALEDRFGRQGGSGIAVRAGRAWLHHATKDLEAVLGLADVAFRLLPMATKIKLGIQAMADMFNNTSDQIVRLEEEADRFLYHVERCPECWRRTATTPICQAGLGMLQEGLHWSTGGKHVHVEEIRCIAMGDRTCSYSIAKRPRSAA